MDLKEINKNLLAEFSAKKIRAEQLAQSNKERANRHPAFYKLSKIERDIIFELAKLKIQKQPTAEFAKQLKFARQEKSKILKKLGLSEADLSPKYECEKCKDTGFIYGNMCECFKQRRNKEMIKACGLNADELVTFENFSAAICKDDSQRADLIKLKDFLYKWCQNYPKVKKPNILLCGQTGVGKSFLTQCVASYMLEKGYSVCFVSAFDMNNMMLKYHTTFDASKHSTLVPLTHSDFLFIDDLGTEPIINNVTLNYLFLVLSERERFNKPVIITTNLLPENILDRYNERIYSRLTNKQRTTTLQIKGADLRH